MHDPRLQLALSDNNPNHVKIKTFLKNYKNKRYGYRSRLVEKAMLMLIDHYNERGEDAPAFWSPIKGREDQSIVLGKKKDYLSE